MRVFVSEYVCGGGWPESTIGGSLAVEGRAMLCAIVDDLSRVAGVQVQTTWDARSGEHSFKTAHCVRIDSPGDELQVFQRLAAECDVTLVIAPEFDGILFDRCRRVEVAGGRLAGPASRAVALCTDKLRLAGHLRAAGVATIPTESIDLDSACLRLNDRRAATFPAVIKPRDGAGSQEIYLVNDFEDLEIWRRGHIDNRQSRSFIRQPYIAGQPVSVAVLLSSSQRDAEVFAPAEQQLSNDGRFRYQGGRIPFINGQQEAIQRAALAACRCIPGLRGYVGIDLVVPAAPPHQPVVVEINPRLTTSYLGYRLLAESNLAEWMLIPSRFQRSICWRSTGVEFDTAGNVRF